MTCRLTLVTPPELASGALAPEAFAESLAAALAAGDVAALLMQAGDGEESTLRAAVAALRPVAHAAEVAVVLETRYDLVRPLGCDGAEVAAEDATLRAARRSLGDDHILGADCRDSRHLGMLAGELGADYVGFSAEAADTLAWWAEVLEVPAVARGGITLETAPALIAAGVDFLALEEAVWQHPDGPAAAVAAFTALCADAAG